MNSISVREFKALVYSAISGFIDPEQDPSTLFDIEIKDDMGYSTICDLRCHP